MSCISRMRGAENPGGCGAELVQLDLPAEQRQVGAVQRGGQLERGGALLLDGPFHDSVDGEVNDHSRNHQERDENDDDAAEDFHRNLRRQYAHAGQARLGWRACARTSPCLVEEQGARLMWGHQCLLLGEAYFRMPWRAAG